MKMTIEQYKISFGFDGNTHSITDCVVRNQNIFCFIASRVFKDSDLEKYENNGWNTDYRGKLLVTYVRNKEDGKNWGWVPIPYDYNETGVYCGSVIIGAMDIPKSCVIVIESTSDDERVFISGSGPAYEDKSPPNWRNGGFTRGAYTKIKCINGYAYVCTGGRGLGKRLENGEWLTLSKQFHSIKTQAGEAGFEDFDAFSETDIYAGGGKGDVWHFDGENWKQVPLPTNEWVLSICCGEDGFVYISCLEGLTYRGRGDKWEKIYSGGISLGFRDMVWFEGKVWCCSDYGVWIIENGKVKPANLPDSIGAFSGHLSVKDGVLLMAGLAGAAFCENGKWEVIINFYEMNKLMRESTETKAKD